MNRNDLTQKQLKRILHYDPDTGLFTWLVSPRRGWAGKAATSLRKDGYVAIKIGKISYLAHRLAWLYTHGYWPSTGIDHINHDEADNRLVNLREADQFENLQNMRQRGGCLGVHWNNRDKRWYARIRWNRKSVHLGCFKHFEDAVAVRQQAEIDARAKLRT